MCPGHVTRTVLPPIETAGLDRAAQKALPDIRRRLFCCISAVEKRKKLRRGHYAVSYTHLLASGFGSMLFDFTNPLYIAESWITFITKFFIGFLACLLYTSRCV